MSTYVEILRACDLIAWNRLRPETRQVVERIKSNPRVEALVEKAVEDVFDSKNGDPEDPRRAMRCWLSNEIECGEDPELAACWVPGARLDELAEHFVPDWLMEEYL